MGHYLHSLNTIIIMSIPVLSHSKPRYLVFVYGTLLKGFKRRKALERMATIKSLGKHSLTGWKLSVTLEHAYPFITYTGLRTNFVVGELLETDAKGMSWLQEVERGYAATPQFFHHYNEEDDKFEYLQFTVFTPIKNDLAFVEKKGLKTNFAHYCRSKAASKELKELLV
jgi:gamma-glutamylcyclotransferase (GGCT)/AIG2-like uncharacterized protein YtfP